MQRQNEEAYESDLRALLGRLESASNHYQRLGLPPSASVGEIKDAYVEAIRLHPRSWKARHVSDDLARRAERGFRTLVEAFTVLSDGDKRFAYNTTLASRAAAAVARTSVIAAPASVPASSVETVSPPLAVPSSESRSGALNRREADRIALRLQCRVTGFSRIGERWTVAGRTEDVSRLGAALRVGRRVAVGQVLFLQLPLPELLRAEETGEPLYDVFAIVRRVDAPLGGTWCIGVEFLGKNPPTGFLANPSALFEIERRVRGDLRSERRHEIYLTFGVRILDERGATVGETVAYSENLSRRGARLRLRGPLPAVDVVAITTPDRAFSTEAVIRNRFCGDDGQDRMCVQFLDACFPVKEFGAVD